MKIYIVLHIEIAIISAMLWNVIILSRHFLLLFSALDNNFLCICITPALFKLPAIFNAGPFLSLDSYIQMLSIQMFGRCVTRASTAHTFKRTSFRIYIACLWSSSVNIYLLHNHMSRWINIHNEYVEQEI